MVRQNEPKARLEEKGIGGTLRGADPIAGTQRDDRRRKFAALRGKIIGDSVPGAETVDCTPPDRQRGRRGAKRDAFRSKFGARDQSKPSTAADNKARVEDVGGSMPPDTVLSADGCRMEPSKMESSSAANNFPELFCPGSFDKEPPALPFIDKADPGQEGSAHVDASAQSEEQGIMENIGVGQVPISFRDPSKPAQDGDIMAEAFLVEDEKDDIFDDVEFGDEIPRIDQGGSASEPPFAVATARKVSPIVRFAQDHCLVVCAAALLLVGSIAGISAHFATRITTDPTPEPSPTPSFAPTVSSVPSEIPSLSPTSAPTLPCNLNPEERSTAIYDDLSKIVTSPESLDPMDTSDPASRAAAWVANEDVLSPPLCPGRDAARLEQRFGLALLLFSTDLDKGGDGWQIRSSERSIRFLSDINECDWAGVGCDSDTNTVTRISLAGRNLNGELPLELFHIFGDLKELNMANNYIYGFIQAHVANLTKLEFLYLQNNEITGSLPPALGRLPNLRELKLSGNNIEGTIPPSILEMSELEVLDLSRNKMTGALHLPGTASKVRHLATANSTNTTSHAKTAERSLWKLRTIDLSSNLFSGPLPDYSSSELVHLRLNENGFAGGIPPSIFDSPNLEELHLHRNRLTGELSPDVGDLINLRSLSLSNNNLDGNIPDTIGELESLELLRLHSNPLLEGPIPASLFLLQNVSLLSIQGTGLVGNVGETFCTEPPGDKDIEGDGGSSLEQHLIATCDAGVDTCDPQTNICCACCDCRELERTIDLPEREFCDPFGLYEEEGGGWYGDSELISEGIEIFMYSEDRSERISALLPIASYRNVLSQNSSAQARASDWLVDEDQFFSDLSPSDAPDILLRYVMAVLYYSTDGDNWSHCSAEEASNCGTGRFAGKERFLSNSPVCNWAGIRCEDDYVSIELDRNGLQGEVPLLELGNICLDALSLGGNPGIEFGFESTYLLNDLRRLDLSDNALTGTFQREGPGDLLFGSISELDLAGNFFSGTIPSGCCGGQLSIDLSNNLLTGSLPYFGGYEIDEATEVFPIQDVRLDNNLLNGTISGEAISQLDALETITLQNNDFSGAMPDSVCDLTFSRGGQLEDLWADCANDANAELVCECCTQCFE